MRTAASQRFATKDYTLDVVDKKSASPQAQECRHVQRMLPKPGPSLDPHQAFS